MSNPTTTEAPPACASQPTGGRLVKLAALAGSLSYTAMTVIALIFRRDADAAAIIGFLWAVCMAVAFVTYRAGSVFFRLDHADQHPA